MAKPPHMQKELKDPRKATVPAATTQNIAAPSTEGMPKGMPMHMPTSSSHLHHQAKRRARVTSKYKH